MMTDTTPESSFNENSMHDTSDELNTPNVSPEKDNTKDVADNEDFTHTSYGFSGNDFPKNILEQEVSDGLSESSISNSDSNVLFDKDDMPSSTVNDSEDVKPAKKDGEELAPTEPSVIVKKEKPENGELLDEKKSTTETKRPIINKGLNSNLMHYIKSVSKISSQNRPILTLKKNLNGQLILCSSNKKPVSLKPISNLPQVQERDPMIKVLPNTSKYSKEKFEDIKERHFGQNSSGGDSSSDGGDKTDDRSSVASPPVPKPTDNGTSNNLATDDDIDDDTETVIAPQEEARPVISVRKPEDLMITRPQMNGGLDESCSVCGKRFGSPVQLEQHRHSAGHFSCSDCSGSVFQTPQELGQHQATHHQSSVQQLAQQVQRLPAQFQSPPSYRVPTPPQRNQYMSPPPMVPYYQGGMGVPHEAPPQTIGSGVVLSPVVATPPVPNLPPGIQLSKRPAPQQPPPEHSSPKQQRREEIETRRLPDSITLSRTPAQPPSPARNSVTDMLANRGITVVPSSGRPPSSPQPTTPTLPRALSSAISITPSSQTQSPRQQSNFAVPAPKPVSRVLTVDLTKEADNPPRRSVPQRGGRIRGPSTRSVCQICDKAFPTPQELQQHMTIHRGGAAPNKLAYECRECTAQYPTEAGLQAHRQKYHGAGGPSPDMAIPVVDLKQVGVMSRLAALGIRSVIPLSQLHSGSGNGLFGVPVVAVDAANNPAICNIGGLGASNLLPLGPLKNLTFNSSLR